MRSIKFRAWDKVEKKMIYPKKKQWQSLADFPAPFIKSDFEMVEGKPEVADCLNGTTTFLTLDGKIVDVYPYNAQTPMSTVVINWSERFELMQFTGLKDKNGKEIYDGDYGRYDDDENLIRIRWSEIQARFIMDAFKSGSWLDGFYNFNEVVAQDLEIIGNIYENPNLLKEERDEA